MHSARRSGSAAVLLDPLASEWSEVAADRVALSGTPLATQPSAYVRARFDPHDVGRVRQVDVRSAHDGEDIYFRLVWEDDRQNLAIEENNQFPDGCGLLLPLGTGDPPMQEMGSPEAPVNAWFWRADFGDTAHNLVAEGLGTTRPAPSAAITARSAYAGGAWHVVLSRPLASPEPPGAAAQLMPGTATRIGFAIWEGGNGERAGVKAFSREWRELAIE